jgi:SAM-dependent methyltransferase
MGDAPSSEGTELEALRVRIEELERERQVSTARANAALAAAQDRSYWLDRWNVDLNALMRKPGARQFRGTVRAARSVYRLLNKALRGAQKIPARAKVAGQELRDEGALAQETRNDRFARTVSPDPLFAAPVTELLHARLGAEDLAAIRSQLEPAEAALVENANPTERKRLELAFAAHHAVQPSLQRSGLSAAMPDVGVHSMAHGPLAAGGSMYYADLVVDALRQSGHELTGGQTGLDFGCSSGRVVRVLAAAHPELEWHGCDPIPDAIEWAQAHLPGIAFTRSPDTPPLPYADGSFDLAFAISIWSHFAEHAALTWLGEMRRIILPGGHMLLTTHGEQTVVHSHRQGLRSQEQLDQVRTALFEHGFWYAAEFGEAGDHGVTSPEWGTAFLTPEWLLAKLTPEWRLAFFRPGRVEEDQDLYVFERN